MKRSICKHKKAPFVLMILLLMTPVLLPGTHARNPPGFSLQMLDGGKYTLADDIGNSVILLEFWGLCCRARLGEMKALDDLYTRYKDKGLKVYAINIDDASARSKVKPALKRYGFSFPVLLDHGRDVFRKYSPAGKKPYTVIIGKNGEIVEAVSNEDPGAQSRIEECVRKLLATDPGDTPDDFR